LNTSAENGACLRDDMGLWSSIVNLTWQNIRHSNIVRILATKQE